MAVGFDSTAWTDFVRAWFVWMLTFIDLDGGKIVVFPKVEVSLRYIVITFLVTFPYAQTQSTDAQKRLS